MYMHVKMDIKSIEWAGVIGKRDKEASMLRLNGKGVAHFKKRGTRVAEDT